MRLGGLGCNGAKVMGLGLEKECELLTIISHPLPLFF